MTMSFYTGARAKIDSQEYQLRIPDVLYCNHAGGGIF